MPAPLLLLLTVLLGAPLSTRADNLIVLLDAGSCPNCTLADADLVCADLSDANLNAADLRRANLSRARLDGADLRNADLRFSNLKGASLRGSDLRGAWLDGTDLRQADLSGALINPGALDRSHWLGAMGINQGLRSPASLHNAGVDEANAGRWPQAERLLGEAIQADPEQAKREPALLQQVRFGPILTRRHRSSRCSASSANCCKADGTSVPAPAAPSSDGSAQMGKG